MMLVTVMAAGAEDDPGFDRHNVMVVFNHHGKLALIRRYYVTWQ